jgi:CheY-like chemotaxis protein
MDKLDASILLVEDEPTLQFVFERQLKTLGYRVAAFADDGLLAIEKVLSEPFHLVFMDVRLPEIDGITATERIRVAEAKNGTHTTIIGMTAFAHRARCLEAGMDDFLQKPVLLEQLETVIAKWLNTAISQEVRPKIEQVEMQEFAQTETKLKAIEEKIANLRKRVGLDEQAPDNAPDVQDI